VGAAALHDGLVGRQVAVAHGLHEFEAALEGPLVQVVEEQPSDAAGLITML